MPALTIVNAAIAVAIIQVLRFRASALPDPSIESVGLDGGAGLALCFDRTRVAGLCFLWVMIFVQAPQSREIRMARELLIRHPGQAVLDCWERLIMTEATFNAPRKHFGTTFLICRLL
jgi:hypothetical protein